MVNILRQSFQELREKTPVSNAHANRHFFERDETVGPRASLPIEPGNAGLKADACASGVFLFEGAPGRLPGWR
jgi:hypothetical protein